MLYPKLASSAAPDAARPGAIGRGERYRTDGSSRQLLDEGVPVAALRTAACPLRALGAALRAGEQSLRLGGHRQMMRTGVLQSS